MPVHDDLGTRMKTYYEQIPKTKLMRRTPVAIRIDGKAFHTFTRGFQKPFDNILIESMQETMKYLCENIQGCVLGYTQSDEITLLLVDYKELNSQAWFDYEVQKMCSIAASMATMKFNQVFAELSVRESEDLEVQARENPSFESRDFLTRISRAHCNSASKGAMFDARCFNIPKEEICNLIYWRQLDAIRNSIQMVGQAYFSHKELQGKACRDIQDMLVKQKGIDWNSLPVEVKRGSACIKIWNEHEGWEPVKDSEKKIGDILCLTARSEWIIDKDMPILKGESRTYIDKLIYVGE